MMEVRRILLTLFITPLIFTGCGGGGDSDQASSSPGDDSPVGIVSSSGFWITPTNVDGDYSFYRSANNLYNTECSIASTSAASSELTCMLDVREGDLFVNDIEIQYNAPAGFCSYVRVLPMWYYNFSTGKGPKKITVELAQNGDFTDLANGVASGCQATLEDNSTTTCTLAAEVSGISPKGIPECAYDHSATEGYPNCCFGTFTYEIYKDSDGDGDAANNTPTTVTAKWGADGDLKECIGGPFRKSWSGSVNETTGVPFNIVTKAETGINSSILIPKTINMETQYFSYQTNYYETSGTPHTHTGYNAVGSSTKPYAFEPINDLDGTLLDDDNYIGTPRDRWIFQCLDAGYEVKHQIGLYIREWNTNAHFLTYGTSGGTVVNDDITGVEGVACDYSDGPGGAKCNDFEDWDDILTKVGGSHNTGAANATLRNSWHPKIVFE